MTKRYLDIDFCKGLLIVMVVWGHFCAHSSGSDYEKNALTMYIRLFQMPLFFMISGLFQKRITNTVEFLYSVKRCFYRLGLPLISFSIMDYMARGLFQNDLGGGIFFIMERSYSLLVFYMLNIM